MVMEGDIYRALRIFGVFNPFWPAKGLPYLITQSIGYGNEQF